MKPQPQMPDDCGSTTFNANCTAAAASMALPPCARMRAPAAAAAGCETATTPPGEAASTEEDSRQKMNQRAIQIMGHGRGRQKREQGRASTRKATRDKAQTGYSAGVAVDARAQQHRGI